MKSNSWIFKALMLGTVFFLAVLLVKPIGVSTQFSVLSGIFHSALDNNVIVKDASSKNGYSSTNAYYEKSDGKLAKAIQQPLNYDFIFVLLIPVGAYIAYRVSSNRRKTQGTTNQNVSNVAPVKQSALSLYLLPFLGGFILLYGARMAGGCTSGHMMSGMMQGSISGYIFAASVFAVAIPTAMIVGKLSQRRS